MKCEEQRKEILITDLATVFYPQENISSFGELGKWRAVSYECTAFSGVLLSAVCASKPNDITFQPNLKGWYKIFLVLPCFAQLNVFLKLSSDEAFENVRNAGGGYEMVEVLWRCADLTNESITVTRKHNALSDSNSALAGIRFVPMTQAEVEEWKYENERKDTKNLYVGNDMHNIFYYQKMHALEDWWQAVLPYKGSDVEWFAPEEIRMDMAGKTPSAVSDFAFFREGDRNAQEQLEKFNYDDILKTVVDKAHEIGIKVAVSVRMGAWGIEYPYDQTYFDSPFFMDNPQWRCVDRNGDRLSTMSYAYPEVRAYMVKMLINAAKSGCDAISLIGHRGVPLVLFEKPVVERFRELYGEEPYEFPLDEPRLNQLHCDIMTDFIRELREALDAEFGKNKVEIHLRSQYSPIDARNVGFDIDTLVKEGLITTIVSYPHRCYEVFADAVWKDAKKTRIDLAKYTETVRHGTSGLWYAEEFDTVEPYCNSRGEVCGPATKAERVAEWQKYEDAYGIKIYYEIFPRVMPNEEFQQRAIELYDAGAKRIALWDTSERSCVPLLWNLVKKLGHKDELKSYDPYMNAVKKYRVLRYGVMDINKYKPMWGG